MNNWEEKKIRTFYSICILWCISNDLYHDISSGMGDEEGDEPITNKEYPGGRVGLGARVIKVRLLFRPWFWWWERGGSDQENFWLICPVLPDSDQLYFNFHLPPKITKICFLLVFCIYKFTNTAKNSNLTCLTMGALVDFVQMPNFWRHLQSTPDQIWLWSILTKGGWLWQCWVWFWWSAQVADAGRRCSDYRGDKPWVRYTTS